MFGIGAGEFVVILIVGLIVFGPSKLPEVGRALGKVLREFRKAQAALSDTLNEVEEPLKIKQNKVESPKPPAPNPKANVTADDVINLAKERPIVKESSDEKTFNGNPNDAPANDARAGVAGAGGGPDGTDKQSQPATDGTINPNR